MQSSTAGQLTSLEWFSEGTTYLNDRRFGLHLVVNCVCAQVPDAVPGGSVGVSILPVLCEDQETVGSLCAAGEKLSIKYNSSE